MYYKEAKNLNQAILAAMKAHADKPCFKIKKGDRFRDITYRSFKDLTFRMVKYLQGQGISNSERVAIALHNCLEWMVVYMASLLSGGVVVPLRASLAPDTLHFTLQDSGARLLVLAGGPLRTSWALLRAEKPGLPDLRTVVVVNDGQEPGPEVETMARILAKTAPPAPAERQAIQDYALNLPPETLASIHYTRGETGRLKGAVFDHARALKSMQHMAGWFSLDEDDLAFTVEPWDYGPSLKSALHYFLSGVANVLSKPDDKTVAEDMRQTSPTVTLNSPYFFERFYDNLMKSVTKMPEASQAVFHWAVAKSKEFRAAGPTASTELREAYVRADLTFFSQVRGEIGGRMQRLYSTGAPLPQNLADFFEAIGLPVLNVYSLTEAGGFPAVSQIEAQRPGSCGRVAPGFEIQIAGDGEILVRGETLMSKYWGWPSEIRQVVDSQGWLHSGDLGQFDADGYLYLTGRKQPLMVLSTGRKIMPSLIEEALMASPFIHQAVIFGEGWPYVSALIVPNLEALADHFQENENYQIETINIGAESVRNTSAASSLKWFWQQEDEESEPITTTAHPRVKALLDKVVDQVNSRLDRWEQIRQYSLLEQAHSKATNDLAEALTRGRHLITEQYARQIEAMYPRPPQLEEKEITQVYVSPERMRELLEKESILDAWLADAGIEFLFNLARAKQIDVPSMVHICDAAATIAQMEHEEKPLSTAFIVGDPARIARVLPRSEIQLLQGGHIRRMRQNLITLARMVDGLVLGYIIDKHGYVRSIRRLKFDERRFPVKPARNQTGNLLLGPQFRHRAAISQLCEAMVFFVPTGGRQVRVFADGQLVGRYSNGDWSPDNMQRVGEVMAQLVERKNYGQALVQRVLRCAFHMSEENLGAIFIIGNADAIMEYSDAPEISHFALIVSADLDELSDQELINFAKQDGATVIDIQGRFRGCMVLLRPSADTKAEIGPGKGARHSSAAKMSAEAQCLAVTVSQDGPITIYDCGHRILSL